MNITMVKNKSLTRVLALLLMLITCFSVMSVTASAATSGGENTRTISVRTKADWSRPGSESITLKQNKCKYTYRAFSRGKWVTKTASVYPNYNITITLQALDIDKVFPEDILPAYGMTNTGLSRNTSYTITVSYNWANTWYDSNCKLGTWINSPCWWVSRTCKASIW